MYPGGFRDEKDSGKGGNEGVCVGRRDSRRRGRPLALSTAQHVRVDPSSDSGSDSDSDSTLNAPTVQTIEARTYPVAVMPSTGSASLPKDSDSDGTISKFVTQAPFDDASMADIVLRSSDGVDFYTSKAILAFASPIFRDMTALPTPPSSSTDRDDMTKDGLPVVVMHESTAPVLDALLRILYPIGFPKLEDFHSIAAVAFAAKKYEMVRATEFVEQALVRASEANGGAKAMQVYMIACAHGFKEVARKCARKSLEHPFDTQCSVALSSGEPSAVDVWRLIVYRKAVEDRISDMFGEELRFNNYNLYENAQDLSLCRNSCGGTYVGFARNGTKQGRSAVCDKWRVKFLEAVHRVPLAFDVVSTSTILDALEESKCEACRSHIMRKSSSVVEAYKKEMLRITSMVRRVCSG